MTAIKVGNDTPVVYHLHWLRNVRDVAEGNPAQHGLQTSMLGAPACLLDLALPQ
jgi:hypothetical protein